MRALGLFTSTRLLAAGLSAQAADPLQWQISNGQNQQLADYASEMLPTVLEHLRMAQQMQLAELTGSAPPR